MATLSTKRRSEAISALSVATVLLCWGCHGTRPDYVGRGTGSFAPCPESPNCVSTYAADSMHRADPLTYEGDASAAMERLAGVVDSMKRTRIATRSDTYLYVEYTSAFWRFVDDVEFMVDDSAKVIHFRSASRLGFSDMGVNRQRMETVRSLFEAANAGQKKGED